MYHQSVLCKWKRIHVHVLPVHLCKTWQKHYATAQCWKTKYREDKLNSELIDYLSSPIFFSESDRNQTLHPSPSSLFVWIRYKYYDFSILKVKENTKQ